MPGTLYLHQRSCVFPRKLKMQKALKAPPQLQLLRTSLKPPTSAFVGNLVDCFTTCAVGHNPQEIICWSFRYLCPFPQSREESMVCGCPTIRKRRKTERQSEKSVDLRKVMFKPVLKMVWSRAPESVGRVLDCMYLCSSSRVETRRYSLSLELQKLFLLYSKKFCFARKKYPKLLKNNCHGKKRITPKQV